MKYLLFLLFGSMEFFSILTLGIVLFRNRLNYDRVKKAMTISVILSILSLILYIMNLSNIAPIIQLIVMIILVKYFNGHKFLYSTLITVGSYVIATLIQAGFIFVTNYYGFIKFSETLPFTNKGYTIQFVSLVIVLLISFVIKRTNEGYSFIPEEGRKKNVKINNKVLLFVYSIAAFLTCGFLFEYNSTRVAYIFEILFITLSLLALMLIIVALLRDKEENEYS